MQALTYLFFTKIKASIRNIFSNAVSGIITFVSVVFVVGLIYLLFTIDPSMHEAATMGDIYTLVMGYIGAMFVFATILFFQKRTALVYKADANYIFSGPFSRRTVLNYVLIDSVKAGFLYALFASFYMCMMSAYIPGVTLEFVGFSTLTSLIMMFVIIASITYFYLLELTNPNAKNIKRGVIIVIGILAVCLFAKSFLQTPTDLKGAFQNFLADPLFYGIPLFGFTKMALMGFAENNMLLMALGIGLNLIICIVLWMLVINIPGEFYEKVMEDAEWADEVLKQARQGKTRGEMDKKLTDVKNASFKEGAGAISSKNILVLRKTKNWIRLQEIFLMIFYLFLVIMMDMNYTFYQYYILIILVASANNDFMIQDLKIHYIYLIPDKPFKKIMHLILPMIIKMSLSVIFGLTIGFIYFRVSLTEYLVSIINILSYGMMFTAGSIWSIRLLKSGNNAFAEQMIKMGVMLAACIPAVALTIAVLFITDGNIAYDTLMTLISAVSLIANALVGFVFVFLAKDMMNGANIMAD